MNVLLIIISFSTVISVAMYLYLNAEKSKIISQYGELLTLGPPQNQELIDKNSTTKYLERTYYKIDSNVNKTNCFRSVCFGMLCFCMALNLLVLSSAAIKISFFKELDLGNIVTFMTIGSSSLAGYAFFNVYKSFQQMYRDSLRDLERISNTLSKKN